MEQFTDQHSKLLLSKEWLVKIDTQSSTPYLIKFYSSTVEWACCILITDTRTTWTEVLNSRQFARRWRECNRLDTFFNDPDEEDEWRNQCLQLLSKAHTLGGIIELSLEVISSHYADFAFELECEAFKWRWETYITPPKISTEILSKHLIMPLISINHLAFASADPVSELSETDLEQAADKIGRTARRTVDTHVKHAMSKPRIATTLQRMTAMFNFLSDLPPINFTADRPDMRAVLPMPKARTSPKTSEKQKAEMPRPEHLSSLPNAPKAPEIPSDNNESQKPAVQADSATEDDDDVPPVPEKSAGNVAAPFSRSPSLGPSKRSAASLSPLPPPSRHDDRMDESSDSSPRRPPAKKGKLQVSSSDDDSEMERKQRMNRGAPAKRGTRQPIKRGGKRF